MKKLFITLTILSSFSVLAEADKLPVKCNIVDNIKYIEVGAGGHMSLTQTAVGIKTYAISTQGDIYQKTIELEGFKPIIYSLQKSFQRTPTILKHKENLKSEFETKLEQLQNMNICL